MGPRHHPENLAALIIITGFYVVFSQFREGTIHYSTPMKIEIVDNLIIEKYRIQSRYRKTFLKIKVNVKHYGGLHNVLVPEVFCKNLVKIGNIEEKEKWICNPTSMLKWPKCVIYSIGINNNLSFEEDLQNFLNNKCKLRCLDKDEQSPGTYQRIKNVNGIFKKAFIGAGTTKKVNMIKNLLLKIGDKRIDILKIDIDGIVFFGINHLLSIPICQILVEDPEKSAEKTLKLLQTLSKNGFYLFRYEVNRFHQGVDEYSFIHEKCFSLFDVQTVYGKYLS